jgi:hypothetical protein
VLYLYLQFILATRRIAIESALPVYRTWMAAIEKLAPQDRSVGHGSNSETVRDAQKMRTFALHTVSIRLASGMKSSQRMFR